MLSNSTLKALHKIGIRYTFKLPWEYAEENVLEVIEGPRSAMDLLYEENRVRMPFGPGVKYCFYIHRGDFETILDGDLMPNAVIAYQKEDDAEVYLTIIDKNDNVLTFEGESVLAVIHHTDGETQLNIAPRPSYANYEFLPEPIEALCRNAATIFSVSMFVLNYRETREGKNERTFKRAARQRRGMPRDHVIQVSRFKYLYNSAIEKLKLRKGSPKQAHMRRGSWCTSSMTGRRWWRRPCAIHGGGGDQDYRL